MEHKESKQGKIIEILSNIYVVKLDSGELIKANIRGALKGVKSLVVGDVVEIDFLYDTYIIKKVLPRNNFLIRPPVANIDNLIICLSLKDPTPDHLLLDKELILCYEKNINPIICLNKADNLEQDKNLEEEIEYIKNVYCPLGIKVIFTSAKKRQGIEGLEENLKGKISAFSGNSGVGKSSLISIITKDMSIEVGNISRKSLKGKNTTKYVRLYELGEKTYILDTPGFSSYELYDINYKKIKDYYKEFREYKCKYEDCTHVFEDECSVKAAVNDKKIDKLRYERYKYIYKDLYEKDKRKYK